MDISKKFAVVDLETTGTNKNEDKIIQFGCTLIDNGKISDSISLLINPHQKISKKIKDLTLISDEMVTDAPDFKDIAGQIFEYLKGRTFVAHNVNFDFPFIKNELILNGFPELNVPAIDTVELSQILLPQLSSFKLQDIAEYLNIEHDHPHRADDDANVTAKLLLILIQRIYILPLDTLKTICDISVSTIRQTSELFLSIYDKRKYNSYFLPDYLYEKHGIVLRRKNLVMSSNSTKSINFPCSDLEKKSQFKNILDFRNNQVSLMNDIYNITENESKRNWSIFEAPTGIGKTIGYLYPISFKISDKRKLVVATTTTILQSQIQDEVIPILNRLNNFKYNTQIVKSSSNYIDLDRFYNTLYQDLNGHKVSSILKMKILVWLTITTTGDLSELRLSNEKISYLSLISSRGEIKENSLFSNDDFWKFSIDNANNSEILITNQAYFSNNLESTIWGDNPYLVVDEAHHFAGNLRKSNSPKINIKIINNEIKKISDTLYQNRTQLRNKFDDKYSINWSREDLQEMESFFQQLNSMTTLFNEYIYDSYLKNRKKSINEGEYIDVQFLNSEIDNIDHLTGLISELKNILTSIIVKIDNLIDGYFKKDNFSGINIATIISNLGMYNNNLRNITVNIINLITKLNNKNSTFGLSFQQKNNSNHNDSVLNWYELDITKEINYIDNKFSKIFLISGAINSNDNFNFFTHDLQISDTMIESKKIYDNQFDLDKNTRIYVPNDTRNIRDMSDDEYNDYLVDMLVIFLKNNKHQSLVLFNSLRTMDEVFIKLNKTELGNQKEILAQGVNGTNEKIKKRFANSKNSVLLGSNSFWEGVDFPKKILEIVIVTRLPFDSPDQDETMIRSKYLLEKNLNAFRDDALPRATLKLKQGFGRLIRTPVDKGVMIILDDRIVKAKYGSQMLSNFPSDIIVKNESSVEIKAKLEDFLD